MSPRGGAASGISEFHDPEGMVRLIIIFLIIIVFLTKYSEGGMGSKQNPKTAARPQMQGHHPQSPWFRST
jgi:hypothetical protein